MAKKSDNDIISVIDDDFDNRPQKSAVQQAAPDYSDYKSDSGTGVRHYNAPYENAAEDSSSGGAVQFFGSKQDDQRPSLDSYTERKYEESSLGSLYSDSGKTICMVMRVISCLFFIIAPISFVCDMLALFGGDSGVSSGTVIASVVHSLIGAVMYVIAGFLVIALIKILQNLMALQKKK